MEEGIKFLEFLKFFTLKGHSVGFRSSSNYIDYIENDTLITTPEGFTFTIKSIRVNLMNNVFTNNKSEKDYMWYDLRNLTTFTSNPENLMKPEMVTDSSFSGNSYKRFVFISKYFEEQKVSNPQWVLSVVNEYGTSNRSYDYFPFSIIILVKSSDELQFTNFLNLKYGTLNFLPSGDGNLTPFYDVNYMPYSIQACELNTWKYYFNKSVGDALKFHNFNNFLKYDFRVLEYELSLDNRIELIKYFINQEFWGVIDFDGLNEQEITIRLIENISDNDKIPFYDIIFLNSGEIFRKLHVKFDEEHNLKFGFFLIKIFYKKISNLDIQNFTNDLEDYPIDKVIPILSDLYKENPIYSSNLGSIISYEYNNLGLKLNSVNIGKVVRHPSTGNNTVSNFEYNVLQNKQYEYDEIVLALCVRDRLKVGLRRGKCYPIPAFAIPLLHNGLSEKYTIIDLTSGIFDVLGIIIPFFRLAQGFAIAEAIGLTLTTTSIITGNFKSILLESDEGKSFLFYFNLIVLS